MIKTFGYDSSRTNPRVLEEDLTIGQQAAKGSKQIHMEETSPRPGLGSPKEKKIGPRCGLNCPKNYFQKS